MMEVKSQDSDIKEATIQSLKGAMREGDYGLFVITPDFDNFTAKLIAADKYSKYMTEIPILEGVKRILR